MKLSARSRSTASALPASSRRKRNTAWPRSATTIADTNIALGAYRKSDNFLASPPDRLALHMILDVLSMAVVERVAER